MGEEQIKRRLPGLCIAAKQVADETYPHGRRANNMHPVEIGADVIGKHLVDVGKYHGVGLADKVYRPQVLLHGKKSDFAVFAAIKSSDRFLVVEELGDKPEDVVPISYTDQGMPAVKAVGVDTERSLQHHTNGTRHLVFGDDAITLSEILDAARKETDELHDFVVWQALEEATLPQSFKSP